MYYRTIRQVRVLSESDEVSDSESRPTAPTSGQSATAAKSTDVVADVGPAEKRPYMKNKQTEYGPWRRVLMTEPERHTILDQMHTKDGHLGVSKTLHKVEARYYWPGISLSVKQFVGSCHICQVNNRKIKNNAPPMHPVPVEEAKPWTQIGIDLVSVCPSREGNKYIITVIDYFTKHASARAIPNKSAANVASFLFDLMTTFGFPKVMISDQGREFCNQLIEELTKKTGIDHRVTAPYHPQANGLVERFNQTIQSMLAKATAPPKDKEDWESVLQSCVFAYNTSLHKTTKYTPHYLMFGAEATLAVDIESSDETAAVAPDEQQAIHTRIQVLSQLNDKIRTQAKANIE